VWMSSSWSDLDMARFWEKELENYRGRSGSVVRTNDLHLCLYANLNSYCCLQIVVALKPIV
jgi:hypothetical protein